MDVFDKNLQDTLLMHFSMAFVWTGLKSTMHKGYGIDTVNKLLTFTFGLHIHLHNSMKEIMFRL